MRYSQMRINYLRKILLPETLSKDFLNFTLPTIFVDISGSFQMATRRSKAKNASPSSNSPPPSPAATHTPRVFASMTRMTRAPLGMRNEVLILLVLFLTSLAVLSSEDVGEYDAYAHPNKMEGGMDMVMDEVMMARDVPHKMDATPMMAKGGAAFRMSADPPPPSTSWCCEPWGRIPSRP